MKYFVEFDSLRSEASIPIRHRHCHLPQFRL